MILSKLHKPQRWVLKYLKFKMKTKSWEGLVIAQGQPFNSVLFVFLQILDDPNNSYILHLSCASLLLENWAPY